MSSALWGMQRKGMFNDNTRVYLSRITNLLWITSTWPSTFMSSVCTQQSNRVRSQNLYCISQDNKCDLDRQTGAGDGSDHALWETLYHCFSALAYLTHHVGCQVTLQALQTRITWRIRYTTKSHCCTINYLNALFTLTTHPAVFHAPSQSLLIISMSFRRLQELA